MKTDGNISDVEDVTSIASFDDTLSDDDTSKEPTLNFWVKINIPESKYHGCFALAKKYGSSYGKSVDVYIQRIDGSYTVKKTEIRSSKNIIVLSSDDTKSFLKWLVSTEYCLSNQIMAESIFSARPMIGFPNSDEQYYAMDYISGLSATRRSPITFNQWVRIESSTSKYHGLFGIAKGSSQKNCTSVQVYVDHLNNKFSIKTTTILTKALRPLQPEEIVKVKESLGELFPVTIPNTSRPLVREYGRTPIVSSYSTRGNIVSPLTEDEMESVSDDACDDTKSHSVSYNQWIRITNVKSKYKGCVGQIKGTPDKETGRLCVNVYSVDENGLVSCIKTSVGSSNSYEILNEDEITGIKLWLGNVYPDPSYGQSADEDYLIPGSGASNGQTPRDIGSIRLQQWVRIHSSKSKYNGCFAITDDHDNRFSDYYRVDAFVQQSNGKFLRGRTSVSSALLVPLTEEEICAVRELLGKSFPEGEKPGRGRKRKEKGLSSYLEKRKWGLPSFDVDDCLPKEYQAHDGDTIDMTPSTIGEYTNLNQAMMKATMRAHRDHNSVTNISLDSNLQDDCSRSTSMSNELLDNGLDSADSKKRFRRSDYGQETSFLLSS